MKRFVCKVLVVLLLGIMPYLGYADVPGTITFQAYLSDASGNPVEGATDITFLIPGIDWMEQHQGVSVNKGVFSVLLGNQNSLANVDFSQVLNLQIEVNGISRTIPISSVPYAFHANTVEHDTLNNLSCTTGQVAEWDGSRWGCADKASGAEQGSPDNFSHCRICIYYADVHGNSADLKKMMCTRMIDGHHSGKMTLLGDVDSNDVLEMKFKCDGGESGVWNDWDH